LIFKIQKVFTFCNSCVWVPQLSSGWKKWISKPYIHCWKGSLGSLTAQDKQWTQEQASQNIKKGCESSR